MPKLLHDQVHKLNKLYKLSNKAMQTSKPYRISKVKCLFEKEKTSVAIYSFDVSNYKDVLQPDNLLDSLIKRKEIAVQQNEFEEAAILRDREKARLNELLKRRGIEESHKFFTDKDNIYQKDFIL